MFSIKLENNRIYVPCYAQDLFGVHLFIFDTGTLYTCCSNTCLSIKLSEEDCEYFERLEIRGLDNEPIIYYKCVVTLFCVNNINMGNRDIWVTFDKRVNAAVLGFDILKDISFLFDDQTGYMHFFESRNELSRYVKNDEGGE
ncbi:MAG: hypothetical protein NC180_03335 [Muribaculaceae bacterium]|nr:hypothetical protein [Roseburia sp.]MCM1431274.1 hypothetical protein [Muribaculaceae bacterium]MCM1492240.1 hypothetical protein [Muribaculaceae bacterium]